MFRKFSVSKTDKSQKNKSPARMTRARPAPHLLPRAAAPLRRPEMPVMRDLRRLPSPLVRPHRVPRHFAAQSRPPLLVAPRSAPPPYTRPGKAAAPRGPLCLAPRLHGRAATRSARPAPARPRTGPGSRAADLPRGESDPPLGTMDPADGEPGQPPGAAGETRRHRPHSTHAPRPGHPTAALLAGSGLPAPSSGDSEEEVEEEGGPGGGAVRFPPCRLRE